MLVASTVGHSQYGRSLKKLPGGIFESCHAQRVVGRMVLLGVIEFYPREKHCNAILFEIRCLIQKIVSGEIIAASLESQRDRLDIDVAGQGNKVVRAVPA